MIILTPAQANEVRGLTVRGHALVPRLLADGNFALPDAVLSDPYHAVRHAYLKDNGTIVPDESIEKGSSGGIDSPIVGSDWEQSATKIAKYAYSKDWPVGEKIVIP